MGDKLIDLTGKRFGLLTVIALLPRNLSSHNRQRKWLCRCSCDGKEIPVFGFNLRHGMSKSCGCMSVKTLMANNRENNRNRKNLVDLTGQTFGRLTVISVAPLPSPDCINRLPYKPARKWLCRCSCDGKEIRVSNRSLKTGGTKSCGCLQQETASIKRLPLGQASSNGLYKRYKYGAKKRKLEFNLSLNDFLKLTSQKCYYCGTEPSQKAQHRYRNGQHTTAYFYNGLDRLDNSKGYTYGNVVAACGICNKMKHDMKLKEFDALIEVICSRWLDCHNTTSLDVATAMFNKAVLDYTASLRKPL